MYVSASVTHIAALVGPNYRNNVIHFGNDNELKSGLLKISTKPPRVQYSYDAQLSIGGLRKHLAFKNRAGDQGKEQIHSTLVLSVWPEPITRTLWPWPPVAISPNAPPFTSSRATRALRMASTCTLLP